MPIIEVIKEITAEGRDWLASIEDFLYDMLDAIELMIRDVCELIDFAN